MAFEQRGNFLMRVWTGILAASVLGLSSLAASAAPAASAAAGADATVTTTHHAVKLRNGHQLDYTARAGFLPLTTDGTREEAAHIYFVAYVADRPAGSHARPITFVFPGGPGAAATLSHEGPRTVVVKDGEAQVTDNPDTSLAFTDLVLVDPVGTGYSRVTKPEYASLFYGIKQDTDSLVEFVRLYLQRYDASESPLFLSGGSYGSIRSILVAEAAMDRGIPVRGIMVTAEGAILSVIGSDSYYATLIPGFTTVAFVHNKLTADLMADRARVIEEAKRWAWDTCLPLPRRATLWPPMSAEKVAGNPDGARDSRRRSSRRTIFAHQPGRIRERASAAMRSKSIGFTTPARRGPARQALMMRPRIPA
ncbi:MAG: hypothetical protein U1F35_16025 [Steroidobacteraceae bacterium]